MIQISFVDTAVKIVLFSLAHDFAVFESAEHPGAVGIGVGTAAVPLIVFIVPFIHVAVFITDNCIAMSFSINKFALKIVFRAGVAAVSVLCIFSRAV